LSVIRLDRDPPVAFRLRTALRRSAAARWVYRRRWRSSADVVVISYPKAGRTWLRALLGAAFRQHFGLPSDDKDLLDLASLAKDPRVPRVRFKHDDGPQLKRPNELVTDKSEYRDTRVIFLARDLRDLAVSAYFQMTRRERRFSGDLDAFLRSPRGGVDTMIRFFNIWSENREAPRELILLRYEDLHRNPRGELLRALAICGLPELSDSAIDAAVDAASFERMRDLEAADRAATSRLQPGDPGDPESFKTRRGEVGGFRRYLSPDAAGWIETRMREELSAWFGYPIQGAPRLNARSVNKSDESSAP
jgi:hypothetical protein